MTVFEWMALIGAAAWLPQLAVAGYRFLVKPQLYIVPVKEGELTFNSLGPIVNVRAALIAEHKDAVIIEMGMTLTHEKGREIRLVWDSFVERFSELRTQEGEHGEFTRDQIATALKVNTAVPTEKFFRFRDPAFKARYRELTGKADDQLSRISQDDPAAIERFLKSKEFTDLISFYQNWFCWEPGRYDVLITVRVLGLRELRKARTHFVLTEGDVDKIRKNLALIEQRLGDIAAGVPADQQAFPGHWTIPLLEDSELMLE